MTFTPGHEGNTRRRLTALLLLAPSIVFAAGTTVIETARARRPDSPLFHEPPAASLADAIERDDVRQAFGYVRAGQDANDLIAVRDDALTGGEWVFVSPLVWAAATGSTGSVRMLLGHGARLERAQDRLSACLAAQLNHHDVEPLLRASGADSPERCPDTDGARPPLVAFLQRAGG